MAKGPKPIPEAGQKAAAEPTVQGTSESEATTEVVVSATQALVSGGTDTRPFDGEAPDGSDASSDVSEEQPKDLVRMRFKSDRYPYRRGGLIFDAARQWVEHTRETFEAATTTSGREAGKAFEALVLDPIVHVQASDNGGQTWRTVSPPAPDADDEDEE